MDKKENLIRFSIYITVSEDIIEIIDKLHIDHAFPYKEKHDTNHAIQNCICHQAHSCIKLKASKHLRPYLHLTIKAI